MALKIYFEDKDEAQARRVHHSALVLNGRFRYDVGMGEFAVANAPAKATALGTCGAVTCQIVVVHKGIGHGALGHFAADPSPGNVVEGVRRMIDKLGGLPVASVVLAAGLIETVKNYQEQVFKGVQELCKGAEVHQPPDPEDGDMWGTCYYLPFQQEVSLFTMAPGIFTGGLAKQLEDITAHSFDHHTLCY